MGSSDFNKFFYGGEGRDMGPYIYIPRDTALIVTPILVFDEETKTNIFDAHYTAHGIQANPAAGRMYFGETLCHRKYNGDRGCSICNKNYTYGEYKHWPFKPRSKVMFRIFVWGKGSSTLNGIEWKEEINEVKVFDCVKTLAERLFDLMKKKGDLSKLKMEFSKTTPSGKGEYSKSTADDISILTDSELKIIDNARGCADYQFDFNKLIKEKNKSAEEVENIIASLDPSSNEIEASSPPASKTKWEGTGDFQSPEPAPTAYFGESAVPSNQESAPEEDTLVEIPEQAVNEDVVEAMKEVVDKGPKKGKTLAETILIENKMYGEKNIFHYTVIKIGSGEYPAGKPIMTAAGLISNAMSKAFVEVVESAEILVNGNDPDDELDVKLMEAFDKMDFESIEKVLDKFGNKQMTDLSKEEKKQLAEMIGVI